MKSTPGLLTTPSSSCPHSLPSANPGDLSSKGQNIHLELLPQLRLEKRGVLTHPHSPSGGLADTALPPTPTCGWVFGYLHGRGATGLNLGFSVCEEGPP